MKPKVLITGVAGFVGMHTAIRFMNEGWQVVGLDNLNDYYSVDLKQDRIRYIQGIHDSENFKFLRCDLDSDVWVELVEEQFDAVVHLAAQAGVRYSLENPMAYVQANILGFQRVLDFVKKTGISRFVYASSSSVYGKDSRQPFREDEDCNSPESYYAATKKANELMAKAYYHTFSVASIGLRFFTVYGPWGRPDMAPMLFTKAAYSGEGISVFNHGAQKRDFTFIDDVVEGVYRLVVQQDFPKESVVCNIGRGEPVGLMEFIDQIETATGKSLVKTLVPAQPGDVEVTYANNDKLKSMIDYSPSVSLHEGIGHFVKWYKNYYKMVD